MDRIALEKRKYRLLAGTQIHYPKHTRTFKMNHS